MYSFSIIIEAWFKPTLLRKSVWMGELLDANMAKRIIKLNFILYLIGSAMSGQFSMISFQFYATI